MVGAVGQRGGTLVGHSDLVSAIAFSADGRPLASGGEDFTVRVWDVDRQVQLGQPWRWTDATVAALDVDPNGRALLAAHGTAVVRWAFGLDGWRDAGCALAGRELTADAWTELAPNREASSLCGH